MHLGRSVAKAEKLTLWSSEQNYENLSWKNQEEHDSYPTQVVKLFWLLWF